MRRRWIPVTLVLAAVMALGIAGSAVLAHDRGNGEKSRLDGIAGGVLAHAISGDRESKLGSFASRVAGILELEEQQVLDAFEQAKSEMLEERVQLMLEKAVTAGKLTQDEADEYMTWFESRPETFLPGALFNKLGRQGFHKRHKRGGFFGKNKGFGHHAESEPVDK